MASFCLTEMSQLSLPLFRLMSEVSVTTSMFFHDISTDYRSFKFGKTEIQSTIAP